MLTTPTQRRRLITGLLAVVATLAACSETETNPASFGGGDTSRSTTVEDPEPSSTSTTTRRSPATAFPRTSATTTRRTTASIPPTTPAPSTRRPTTTTRPPATTPAPRPAPSTDATALIGRHITDPVVSNYLANPANGCFAGLGNWNCPPASTEFTFDTGQVVHAVMLKAPGVSTNQGYRGGPLPGGITFGDTPEQMVRRFGQPVAGHAAPGSFLKWTGATGTDLFVDFFNAAPLRISEVQLQLQD